MNTREKAKAIRNAVKASGYNFWFSYNDERVGGVRRMKFMRNGADLGPGNYAKWDKAIAKSIQEQGVAVIRCGFEWLERPGYGPYRAYVAVFAND